MWRRSRQAAWLGAGLMLAACGGPASKLSPAEPPRTPATSNSGGTAAAPIAPRLPAPTTGCSAPPPLRQDRQRAFTSLVLLDDGGWVVHDRLGPIWTRPKADAPWRRSKGGIGDRLSLGDKNTIWTASSSSMNEVSYISHSTNGGRSFTDEEVGEARDLDARTFVQRRGAAPLLLAQASELHRVALEQGHLRTEKVDQASPGVRWFDGTSAGGYVYMLGTRNEDSQTTTFSKPEALPPGEPWREHTGLLYPFCSSELCYSASGKLLVTQPDRDEWLEPEGVEDWFVQARSCGGASTTARVVPLGGAARDGLLAIVFRITGADAHAVLVSSNYPSVAFPFADGAQPVTLNIDDAGGILALGDSVYRYAGTGWQRLGPTGQHAPPTRGCVVGP